jgi:hypothetical protein
MQNHRKTLRKAKPSTQIHATDSRLSRRTLATITTITLSAAILIIIPVRIVARNRREIVLQGG